MEQEEIDINSLRRNKSFYLQSRQPQSQNVYPVCNAHGIFCDLRRIIHLPRPCLWEIGVSNHPVQFKTFLLFLAFHFWFQCKITNWAKHELPWTQKMALVLGTEVESSHTWLPLSLQIVLTPLGFIHPEESLYPLFTQSRQSASYKED